LGEVPTLIISCDIDLCPPLYLAADSVYAVWVILKNLSRNRRWFVLEDC